MTDPVRIPTESASALPAGTRLGEFELRSLLGVGGFGIVYLAFDHALEREVAIKEYMPASMAGRTETMHVSLRSQSDAEVFALGLRSFVNEAKLLARFDHPSLLKVYRFWEANGTAYMAMPVLKGRTLKEIRQGRQSLESPIDEAWLRRLLEPLLGALDRLHSEGVYHRDIAPDNIQVEPDGRPVLLDFGAARRVISDKTQTLTAILKPAYAPIEQYAEAGSVKQGPWTDLYALGATIHYMLLGRPPAPATARAVNDDDQAPLASQPIAGCSESFLHMVDWMLAPRPGDRPQSVAVLRDVMAGRASVPQRRPADAVSPSQWERTQVLPTPPAAAPTEEGDATVVVPPSRPPSRDPRATAPAMPQPLHHAAPPPAPAPAPVAAAPRATPQSAAAAAVAPAQAPAPAVRSGGGGKKLIPVAIGAVAVVAAAAYGFWPRSAGTPSAAQPSVVSPAPAPATSPAPAVVNTSTPATATVTSAPAPAPAAPVTTVPAPVPVAPPATATASPATAPKPPVEPSSPPAAAAGPSVAAQPPAVGTPRPAPTAPARATAQRPPAPAAATGALQPAPSRAEQAPVPATSPVASPPPAAAAPGPAPAQPAAPPQTAAAEPPKPASPEARCGGRNPILYFACMERECYRSQFMQHPDCLQWRKNARPRESTGN